MPPVREFVDFQDPKSSRRTWSIDVSFLTSSWGCIYGSGCKGVYMAGSGKESVDGGCCTFGAFLDDEDEVRRVERLAKKLTPQDWQLRDVGMKSGTLVRGNAEDGPMKTRVYKGVCIFSNRAGFEGGMGCAFHHYAKRVGKHPSETKPHACWTLPLRDHEVEWDEQGRPTRMVLTDFRVKDWGEGVSFTWYCIDRPEAFANPAGMVYRTQEFEIRKMVGDELYEEIASYIETRLAARRPPMPHPTQVRVATSGRG